MCPEAQKAIAELKAVAEHPKSLSELLRVFEKTAQLIEEGPPETAWSFNWDEMPPRIVTAVFAYLCKAADQFSREEIQRILLPFYKERFERMLRKLEETTSRLSSPTEKFEMSDAINNFGSSTSARMKFLARACGERRR